VAFIGLGTMGEGMVANLVGAGIAVKAWNRTAARAEALGDRLARDLPDAAPYAVAGSPATAAEEVDAVLLCVSNDDAVARIVFGEDGVAGSLGPGMLLVDHGTTGLEMTARLDAVARERGATFLDAPITGSKLGAASGRLTFMVGGPGAAVERFGPLFAAMGRHAVHVGDTVGLGQRAKYCLNMSQAVVLQGVLEGYALARSSGVSVAKMAEILEHSAGKTGVGSFKTPYLLRGDFEPHFRLDLMAKDLRLAAALAEQVGVVLPLSRAATAVYDRAESAGLGDRDFLATAKLLEQDGASRLRDDE